MLRYDPQVGLLWTALSFSGTVVPHVFAHSEFWVLLAFHVTVKVLFEMGHFARGADPDDTLYIDWNCIKIITAMTTFFEVFYSNQTYARYQALHGDVKEILAETEDFAMCLRGFWWDHYQPPNSKDGEPRLRRASECRQHCQLALRYFLAAVNVTLVEHSDEISDADWQAILSLELIVDDEASTLQTHSRHTRAAMLLQWCARVIALAHTTSKTPTNYYMTALGQVRSMMGKQQRLKSLMDFPTPFQYFHLLSVMLIVNLTLWAWKMAFTESLISPIVFCCTELIFMGMLELASQLSDPFGDDEVDFPIKAWLAATFESACLILEDEAGDEDAWKKKLEAGNGWTSRFFHTGANGSRISARAHESRLASPAQDLGGSAEDSGGYALLLPDSTYSGCKDPATNSAMVSLLRTMPRAAQPLSTSLTVPPGVASGSASLDSARCSLSSRLSGADDADSD